MFELRPTKPNSKISGGVYSKGRILIGRTESCDLMVNHDSISAVHAVLEIFDDRAVIYDMNSTNGTYVNDDKVIVKDVHIGDFFQAAGHLPGFSPNLFHLLVVPGPGKIAVH